MHISRKTLSFGAFILAVFLASPAHAQYGGRQRGGGGEGGQMRGQQQRPDQSSQRGAVQPVADPIAAIERELPSLRIDLKMSAEQAALFDAFERKVRDATSATRNRARHLAAFRFDDGSTVSAASIVGTVAMDDMERADAMRGVGEKMDALYAGFNADQRKQFDRRIMQSQREPLGAS